MSRVILASGNSGKLHELRALLDSHGVELVAQDRLAIAACPENGVSFVENAIAKARHAARQGGAPAIADDSGLVVDALGGKPGVRSARYAGDTAGDAENTALLLKRLTGIPQARRGAYFFTVVVYLRGADDPCPIICEGRWNGRILTVPRGTSGFGYDPVFYVPEAGCSAAQLDVQTKNALSHRGQAVRALCTRLIADLAPSREGGEGAAAAML